MDHVLAKPIDVRVADASGLPRVLYTVAMDPSQKFGSIEEQMVFLTRIFQGNDSLFLPLFICPKPPLQPTPLEQAGVSIACLDMGEFRWKVLLQLLALIRRHKIELVHWNFSEPLRNSYLWWLTLLRPRIKHYYSDHISRHLPLTGPVRGWKKIYKRLLLKRYTKVLCFSQFIFDCAKTENTWSNLVRCRYFINTVRFQPSHQAREKIRAEHHAAECFIVLTVGHLIKAKGIDVILRALAMLPENVVLWVVGTGVEAGELRRLAQDLGLSTRVIFHGSQQHVQPYMQGADCFVCPSLWAEAAGLVNLEAQASGLPVIASNVGGIPEYVDDGRTGFLFPAGNAGELANRICRLMTDPPLRERLGEAARVLVEEQFSTAARLGEMVAIYGS